MQSQRKKRRDLRRTVLKDIPGLIKFTDGCREEQRAIEKDLGIRQDMRRMADVIQLSRRFRVSSADIPRIHYFFNATFFSL